MIIKLIVNKPLNPSTKLAPLIINKKHNNTKIIEKKSFFKKEPKKSKQFYVNAQIHGR